MNRRRRTNVLHKTQPSPLCVMVMETKRVALIRYRAPDGTECVGSGLLVNDQLVLTADHVADGSAHKVEIRGQSYDVSSILRSGSSEVDLAILRLEAQIPDVTPLRCARISQDAVGQVAVSIHGVSAATRGYGRLLEVLVQAEHACGSCPMNPVRLASSGRSQRVFGLSSRRRTSRSRR